MKIIQDNKDFWINYKIDIAVSSLSQDILAIIAKSG